MTAAELLADVRALGADLEVTDAGSIVLLEPADGPPIPDPLVSALLAARDELVALLIPPAPRRRPLEPLEADTPALADPPTPPPVEAHEEAVDETEARRRRFGTDLTSRRDRAAHVDRLLAAEHAPAGLAGWLRSRW